MAYDPNVLRRAVDRLEGERRRRRVELDRLRDRVYGREPRLAQLDRQLQGTMAQLIAATLRQGGNPAQAVRTGRRVRSPPDNTFTFLVESSPPNMNAPSKSRI